MDSFFIVVFGFYAGIMLLLVFGWARSMEQQANAVTFRSISIVVPFRNEEGNLLPLLRSLARLNYPAGKWEVILVNDHSEDGSARIAGEAIGSLSHFKLASIANTSGKKSAIAKGIELARGEIIVTTDADCEVPVMWIHHVNAGFEPAGTRMVVGAVRLQENRSLFSRLQALEFCSLAGTSGATIGLGFPSMCNGANLAFRKAAFIEIGGYAGNEKISSGDDQFLMNKFSQRWKRSIQFLPSEESVVSTASSETLQEFIRQRLRWAGKWKVSSSWFDQLIAVGVWLFHISVLLLFACWFLEMINTRIFLVLLGSKLFVEALFLFQVSLFCKIPWRWSSFFALQFIHPCYVVSIGFLSQIIHVQWKGRDVTTKVW